MTHTNWCNKIINGKEDMKFFAWPYLDLCKSQLLFSLIQKVIYVIFCHCKKHLPRNKDNQLVRALQLFLSLLVPVWQIFQSRWYFHNLLDDCQMTVCCLMTACWWLFDDCLMNAWALMTFWWLSDDWLMKDCLPTAWWLPYDFLMTP